MLLRSVGKRSKSYCNNVQGGASARQKTPKWLCRKRWWWWWRWSLRENNDCNAFFLPMVLSFAFAVFLPIGVLSSRDERSSFLRAFHEFSCLFRCYFFFCTTQNVAKGKRKRQIERQNGTIAHRSLHLCFAICNSFVVTVLLVLHDFSYYLYIFFIFPTGASPHTPTHPRTHTHIRVLVDHHLGLAYWFITLKMSRTYPTISIVLLSRFYCCCC